MAERIKNFKYLKGDGEIKPYELLQLKEVSSGSALSIEGISLGDLTEEQRKELLEADKAYSAVLGKYMKSYKRFNLDHIKG